MVRVPKNKPNLANKAVLASIGNFSPNSPLSPAIQTKIKKKANNRETKPQKKANTFKGYQDFNEG